jgi:hypothetical protein
MDNEYLTISALNNYIKSLLDKDSFLNRVYLKGEISNFKNHTTGHLYFTLTGQHGRDRGARTCPSLPEELRGQRRTPGFLLLSRPSAQCARQGPDTPVLGDLGLHRRPSQADGHGSLMAATTFITCPAPANRTNFAGLGVLDYRKAP